MKKEVFDDMVAYDFSNLGLQQGSDNCFAQCECYDACDCDCDSGCDSDTCNFGGD